MIQEYLSRYIPFPTWHFVAIFEEVAKLYGGHSWFWTFKYNSTFSHRKMILLLDFSNQKIMNCSFACSGSTKLHEIRTLIIINWNLPTLVSTHFEQRTCRHYTKAKMRLSIRRELLPLWNVSSRRAPQVSWLGTDVKHRLQIYLQPKIQKRW